MICPSHPGGVIVQDSEGRWMRTTVARPVSDPKVDDSGQVVAEVPNNRAGGSHPVTPEPPETTDVCPVEASEEEQPLLDVVVDLQEEAKPYNPPRRRLHGKKTVLEKPVTCLEQAVEVPALRVVRAGGGRIGQSSMSSAGGELVGPSQQLELLEVKPDQLQHQSGLSQQQEALWLEGLKLVQHQELKRLLKGEIRKVEQGELQPEDQRVVQEVGQAIQGLEEELQQMQREHRVKSLQVNEDGEVLQTQTVSLEDVKKDLEGWIEPFQSEIHNILSTGAMEVISNEKYQQLLKDHPDLERLPMLAVATIKPPKKRKGRVVVCGNHSTKQIQPGEPDPSVGGVDTVAIRCLLALAVQRQLQVGTIDVKGAFLNAPRRSVALRPTVCDPPNLLKQMKLVKQDEKWLVHKALYGFVESPSDWSFHRDQTMRALRWKSRGINLKLQQSAEKHVWKVVPDDSKENIHHIKEDFGYVAVYVDDLLFAVHPEHSEGVVGALRSAWSCSDPEFVTEDGDMRFCGFELRKIAGGGLRLSQGGFIQEMLQRHQVQGESKVPLSPVTDEPDEINIGLADIRRAQGLVGELTWLTTRSRPDLAYSVGIASRLIHRRPKYVLEMCSQILRYVNHTKQLALTYRRCKLGDMGTSNELQVAKSLDSLQVYSDASYGPVHERCKSISGTALEFANCLVAWDSQAQPFISQSTAEAEVISYNSACQIAQAVGSFLQEMGYPTCKQLYGDSKAGIAVIANECGPWRTRHLRLRASKLRELVQDSDQEWSIRHMSGNVLIADGFTKALQHSAFERFQQRLSLEPLEVSSGSMKRMMVIPQEESVLRKAALAALSGLLIHRGEIGLAGLILIILVVLQRWSENASEMSQEQPRVCAFRGPPDDQDLTGRSAPTEGTSRRRGARERGLAAMEQSVLSGLSRLTITSTVEVACGNQDRPTRTESTSHDIGQSSSRSGEEVHGYPSSQSVLAVWDQPQFRYRPRGADRWEQNLCGDGWLVRTHGSKGRVKPFHPLHRSTPLTGDRLTGERVTVLFAADGSREILRDDWNCQRTWQRPGPWGGFTFFRIHPGPQDGNPKASTGGLQYSQSVPASTATGGLQCSQSVPASTATGGVQISQSLPVTSVGGVQISQSLPVTSVGGLQISQSAPVTASFSDVQVSQSVVIQTADRTKSVSRHEDPGPVTCEDSDSTGSYDFVDA